MENNNWQQQGQPQVPQQPVQSQAPQQQSIQQPMQQPQVPQQPVQQQMPQQPSYPEPQIPQPVQQTPAESSKIGKLKGVFNNNNKQTKKKATINPKQVSINIDKLQKDKDIKDINIKGDLSAIPMIGSVKRSKKKAITKYIFGGIAFCLFVSLAIFCINIGINYKIIQGNIEGKDFNIAGFSFVVRDYDPYNYIKDGKKVYYSEVATKDKFIEMGGDFKIGAVAKVYSDKVAIGDNGIREMVVQKDQVRYVLEDES